MLLPSIETPDDLKALNHEQLTTLAEEIRTFIVDTVTTTGGHLGSNLGAVELTLAVHRVFDSPRDVVLFDTGHQAYVHKLITGRRYGFKTLKQAGGMSGYPNRAESEHDWIENSHASTALSYAHGLANAFALRGADERRVIAVVGDGALTGGMAYEALNNLGHSGIPVVIVLNDNGRSYAPTVSHLSQSLTSLRLNPTYTQTRERIRTRLRDLPALGPLAYSSVHSVTSALREMVAPHTFFEALGVRYAGPIDGHDVELMEQAFAHAAEWNGPIVVHVLTQKGRGGSHELCVNSASHDILSDEWKEQPDERRRQQYSDYFDFRGHRYPRKLELLVNGIRVVTANVNSLTTAPLDEALLVAPKGATERRQCADMKHARPLKTPDPMYPKPASQDRLMGDTAVSLTVLADGSVGDIQLIGRAVHSMDDATLQTLKGWKFKPAMCGDEPVVSDLEVVVSFRLR